MASELSTAPVALQTALLATVNRRCPADVWGDDADTGRAYLAAHLATLARRKGVGGAVTEQHSGPTGQSFQVIAGLFSTTSYGQIFETLLEGLPGARLPVMGGA